MTVEQKIRMAVARGWCHPKNANKVMDTDLAFAITEEVKKELDCGGFTDDVPTLRDTAQK